MDNVRKQNMELARRMGIVGKQVTDFARVRSVGDKNKAMTHDGIMVERQEFFFAEGYGIVKTIPYELHFIFEDTSKKRGRWAFMCFPQNTIIDCQAKQKNIQDVQIGDLVLTHQNRYRRVVNTFSHEYSGNLFTIKTSGNRSISCTEEHPFMVLRGKDFKWVHAQDIVNTDMLVEAIPDTEEVDFYEVHYQNGNGVFSYLMPLEADSYRLFGYYLAEGYLVSSTPRAIRKRYHVDFAFNRNEVEYIQEVSDLMYKYFNARGSIVKTSENGVRISFTTQVGYTVFESLFGKLAFNKSIPSVILNNSKEKIGSLIVTFWRGDGSSTVQGFSFDSTSKNLIYQIQKALYRFDIVSGIATRKMTKSKPSYIDGRVISRKHDLYTLNLYGISANKFSELLGEQSKFKAEKELGNNWSKVLGGVVLHKILGIEKEEVFNLPVYNFEVDEDNSYHAENFIVHNCTCGSIAGIISYNEVKHLMTVNGDEPGYVLACIAHTSSKQNAGVGTHADGSHE